MRRTATCTPRSTRRPAAARRSRRSRIETIIAAATRPHTAGSTAPAKRFVIFTSGVWVLGSAPEPTAEDAPLNPIAMSSHRPAHEQFVLDAASAHLRTVVVRPGVVYGGGSGMVGDIFKAATNGLVRVVGDGNNHWPLVYDRDLADLYAKLAVNNDASGIFHANDEGDERVNDIVSAISPYLAGASRCASRADQGSADQAGTVRGRARPRPDRPQSAGAHARLDADAAFSGGERRPPAGRVAAGAARGSGRVVDEGRLGRVSQVGQARGGRIRRVEKRQAPGPPASPGSPRTGQAPASPSPPRPAATAAWSPSPPHPWSPSRPASARAVRPPARRRSIRTRAPVARRDRNRCAWCPG